MSGDMFSGGTFRGVKMKDHIVEEVRKFREEHSKLFVNNIDEICKDLYQHQIRNGHRLVRFKPKKILVNEAIRRIA